MKSNGLSSQMTWFEVVDFLDLPRTDQALPQQTNCPKCHSVAALTIVDDPHGGAWAWCRSCTFAGDIVDLAGAALELDREATVRCLKQEAGIGSCTSKVISEDLKKYDDRGAALKFWQQASRAARRRCMPPELLQLQMHACFHLHDGPDHMTEELARIVGVVSRQELAEFWRRSVIHSTNRTLGFTAGNDLKDAFVFPYRDLPGRICAFGALGVTRDGPRLVYRAAAPYSIPRVRARGEQGEAGFAGLDVVLNGNCSHANVIVGVGDPMLLTRMQARQLRCNLQPLPLVAWHDDLRHCTGLAWRLFERHRRIIWAWKVNAAAVWQAMRADADLAIVGPAYPTENSISHYLRLDDARTVLDRVIRRARPWQKVLRTWAATAQPMAIADLLLELEARGAHVRELIADLGPRFAEAQPSRAAKRCAIINGWRIIEDGNRWYAEMKSNGRRGEQVLMTDYIVRLACTGTKKGRLVGKVLSGDDDDGIPFNVGAATLKRQGWRAWFIHFLERHGKKAVGCLNGPRVSLVEVATAFCPSRDRENGGVSSGGRRRSKNQGKDDS